MTPKRYLIVFLLLISVFCSVCNARIQVNLQALVPNHFGWADEFKRIFFTKLMSFQRDRRFKTMFRTFHPRVAMTLLKQDSPKEILTSFCDEIFPSNTTTILHINNPLSIRRRPAASQYVTNLGVYFGIPIISWDAEDSGGSQNRVESRTLQIAPTIHHQTQAIFSLLQRYNWTLFSIVTSTAAGHLDFISSLRSLAKNTNKAASTYGTKPIRIEVLTHIILRNTTNSTQTKQSLSQIIETETRVIILHSNSLQSKYIMDYAHEMGIASKEFVWILSQSAIPTAKYAPRAFHLGLLGVSYDHGKQAMENAIKMAATVWITALNTIATTKGLTSKYKMTPDISCESVGSMNWKDGSVFYKYLKNVIVKGPPNIQFNDTGILKSTELKILNIQKRGTGKMWDQVGSWTNQGLLMKDITWPGEASAPPRGKPARKFVRVLTLQEHPYVTYDNIDTKGKCGSSAAPCQVYERDENKTRLSNDTIPKCCVGFSIDLLKILSAELDFDYELIEVEDGQWGAIEQGTKEWNGLPRALADNKGDWVVTSLKITPERNTIVDFSVPYLETGITIIVAIREGAISATAFLEPYDYPSWTLILVFSVHATGASIFIFEWLSPYGLNQGKTTLREHKFSLFRSFWLIWAMLFSAAVSTDTPRGVSSRFLANMWALFALVFLASYTANLAAFMITKEEYYDLSGIQDWRLTNPTATKPPFKYATIPSGSTESNIEKNHKDMYKYMKKYNVPTVQDGVIALKKQQIQAFIYDATVLEYLAGQDKGCRLITVGKWYAMTGYGIAFRHGSPWKNKINKVILELQDQGEMERLQKFWLTGACQKKKKRKSISSHTLGILNFTSAFILLALGMVLGAILLGLEHCYFRFGRSKLKKWDKCGCCALVSLSMGRSLTFEQSVIEAIHTHRKRRCKDAVCETQLWKIKHELDLALLKIDRLEDTGKDSKIEGGNNVWRYNPVSIRQPNGIPRRKSIDKLIKEQEGGSSERLLLRDQEDTRSEGCITPRRRAVLRRSPSYTNAISISECDDLKEETQNKKRYHEGKFYVGVNNDPDVESIF